MSSRRRSSSTTRLGAGVAVALVSSFAVAAPPSVLTAAPLGSTARVLLVDADDTDDDGVEDRLAKKLGSRALRALEEVKAGELAVDARAPATGPLRWVGADGRVVEPGQTAVGRVYLQGIAPGKGGLRTRRGLEEVVVVALRAFDARGREVSWAKEWASLSRVLPSELAESGEVGIDHDALRYVLVGPSAGLPTHLTVVSEGIDGRYRDGVSVEVKPTACPPGTPGPEFECRATPPLRLVGDAADKGHPASVARSIVGEVGGQLRFELSPSAFLSLPLGAPRTLEEGGPGRYRVRLRARVLRTTKGGAPALGTTDAEARELVLGELFAASGVWGQCGIHWGPPGELDIAVVDPPEGALLTIGCGAGLPASGGEIVARLDGQPMRWKIQAGETPWAVAERVARLLTQRGYTVKRFANPRAENAALPSVDLVVTGPQGKAVEWAPERRSPLTTDPSLGVCLTRVTLEDGLEHFTDENAASGTLEERALIRALGDDDPSTIDWFVVPVFSGAGRIGESFIGGPDSSIQNVLLLDRSGVRASSRAFTLAHELGHILLDMPGHPDDYGVDEPTALMDADASDGTIFGPRRLSLEDCRRVLRQSGPAAPVPLLEAWPLRPRAK